MQNGVDSTTDGTGGSNKKHAVASKLQLEKSNLVRPNSPYETTKGRSSCSSSIDLSSDLGSPLNNHASVSHSPISSSEKILKSVELHSVQSSTSSANENAEEDFNTRIRSNDHEYLAEEIHENIASGRSQITNGAQKSDQEYGSNFLSAKVALANKNSQAVEKLISNGDSKVNGTNDGKTKEIDRDILEEAATSDYSCDSSKDDRERKKEEEKNKDEGQNLDDERYSKEGELNIAQAITGKRSLGSETSSSSRENLGMTDNLLKNERLKHVKSVRADSARNVLVGSNQYPEIRESGVQGDAQSGMGSLRLKERKDAKVFPRDTRSAILESKMQQLERRIKVLEGELREAAAVEASLYSVVAEHGSSTSKVHAPARRLSRLYLHACRESSQSRRANAARSAISGLVLVAKACGNDVPRYRLIA